MALPRQTISIPLGVGIDTKTDEKQVAVGKLHTLENGVFDKTGKLSKRNGLTQLSSSTTDGGTISSARGMMNYRGELDVVDDSSFYSYFESQNKWVKKSGLRGVKVQSQLLCRPTASITYTNAAVDNGIILYIWDGSTTGGTPAAFVSLVDAETGQPIANPWPTLFSVRDLSAGGTTAIAWNSKFYLYGPRGDALNVFVCDPTNLSNMTAAGTSIVGYTSLLTDPAPGVATYQWIATPRLVGSNLLVTAFWRDSIVTGYVDSTGNYSAGTTSVATGSSSNQIDNLNVYVDYTGNASTDAIYITYTRLNAGVYTLYGKVLSTSLTTLVAEFTIATGGVCAALGSGGAGFCSILYGKNGASVSTVPTDVTTVSATISRAGAITGTATVFYGRIPESNLFTASGGSSFLVLLHPSAEQPSHCVASTDGSIVTQFSYSEAQTTNLGVNDVVQIDTDRFVYASPRAGRLVGNGTTITSVLGAQATSIEFTGTESLSSSPFGLNQIIASGGVWGYDGARLAEAGFYAYPEIVSVSSVGSSGSLVEGTRSYVAVYEWTDAKGQIYRSAPSTPFSHTVGAGTTRDTSLVVTQSRGSLKDTPQMRVRIYRTVAGGTTYYSVGNGQSFSSNAPTSTTGTYPDVTTDAAIISHEILYTTGGVLESIPPPPSTFALAYGNRVYLMGLEDENAIWYSREYVSGEFPAFSDALTLRIDQGDGGVTSGGVLDDKIVFFKATSTYFTAGQGPTDTGVLDDQRRPQLISPDVGCSEPSSVVQIPNGLLFKSDKGFYLLDRKLNMNPVGMPVEDYNSLTVSSAVHIKEKNQVRFTHTDGVTLVYDYLFDQWGTFTNYTANAAVAWGDGIAIIKSDGTTLIEDASTSLDEGAAVSIKAVTPWIKVDGLQGFQRIYEAAILGEKLSGHTAQVRIGYDYESTWSETKTIASTAFSGEIEQYLIRPARQKCQAIRFEIADLNPSLVDGKGLTLTSIDLTIGVKGGLNRVKASQVST
jgi:hypothetical protein